MAPGNLRFFRRDGVDQLTGPIIGAFVNERGQVLEHDVRAVMFDGFSHDLAGNTVQEHLEVSVFLTLDACYRLVCRPCPALLEIAILLFVLLLPVVELVCRPEPPGRSDRELIHTEDCSVPGGGVTVACEHRRMEIPVAVTSVECHPPKLVVLVSDVLRRQFLNVVGKDVIALNRSSTIDNNAWSL